MITTQAGLHRSLIKFKQLFEAIDTAGHTILDAAFACVRVPMLAVSLSQALRTFIVKQIAYIAFLSSS